MKSRTTRILAVCAAASLVAGAFVAAPAEAKKKKKKKKKACATYQPGDLGSGAELVLVTDKASEDAPIEMEISTGPGLGFTSTEPGGDTGQISHSYVNVQVDSAAAETGLYVRTEFLPIEDYDLFLRDQTGFAVAYQADFNPVPEGLGGGSGGHSEMGAEALDGIGTDDCGGYTLDIASSITPGGSVVLKLWVGEINF